MERTLFGGAVALGAVVWVCCLLLTRVSRELKSGGGIPWYARVPLIYRIAALVIPALAFMATLPSEAPFASGQGLGRGFVLGALGALLSLWSVGRAFTGEGDTGVAGEDVDSTTRSGHDGQLAGQSIRQSEINRNRVALVAPFAIAAVVTAVPLLAMRDVVLDALMGIAMGWLTSGILLLVGSGSAEGGGRAGRLVNLVMMAGTLFAITLCTVAAVGEVGGAVRFGNSALPDPWSAPLLALASTVPLLMLLVTLLVPRLVDGSLRDRLRGSDRTAAILITGWLVGGGVLALLGREFEHKLFTSTDLFRLVLLGMLAPALAWWNLASRGRSNTDDVNRSGTLSLALPLLLMMAACMTAFQMFAGVAVGIVALTGWFTVGVVLTGVAVSEDEALARSVATSVVRAMGFVVVFLLYRLFEVKYSDEIHNVVLLDQYALLGVVVGALLPVALCSYLERSAIGSAPLEGTTPVRSIVNGVSVVHLAVAGVSLLLVPGLMLVLYGSKCLLAIFFGLALSTSMVMHGSTSRESDSAGAGRSLRWDLLITLMAVGLGVALVQWTHHILPMGLMARADKTRLLTYGTGFVVLLLLIAEVGGRLRHFGTPPVPPRSPGNDSGVSPTEGGAR